MQESVRHAYMISFQWPILPCQGILGVLEITIWSPSVATRIYALLLGITLHRLPVTLGFTLRIHCNEMRNLMTLSSFILWIA